MGNGVREGGIGWIIIQRDRKTNAREGGLSGERCTGGMGQREGGGKRIRLYRQRPRGWP